MLIEVELARLDARMGALAAELPNAIDPIQHEVIVNRIDSILDERNRIEAEHLARLASA